MCISDENILHGFETRDIKAKTLQGFWCNSDDIDCNIYIPHQEGGGHIVFGADPVDIGVSVSVTLSCLHNISWTGGSILTKFAWM